MTERTFDWHLRLTMDSANARAMVADERVVEAWQAYAAELARFGKLEHVTLTRTIGAYRGGGDSMVIHTPPDNDESRPQPEG